MQVLDGLYAGMEDAGVFPFSEAFPLSGAPGEAPEAADLVLVQTVDFITPVLDDPYSFGQAAAANALSDIYAMGARPLTAMNLVAFPAAALGEPGREALAAILRGGRDKVAEAGATLVGGHSIEDAEPKYGLAVTGVARRAELLPQSAGRPGDALFLTKPIGGGVLATALKREGLPPDVLAEFTRVLTTLNAFGRDAALAAGARAATDVTGFGLLGHLSNLLLASGVGAEIDADAVPVIAGAAVLAERGHFPGGARRNLEFVSGRVKLSFEAGPGGGGRTAAADFAAAAGWSWRELLLADPMTSGGLLVVVPEARASAFAAEAAGALKRLAGAPTYWCSRVGRLTDQAGKLIVRGTSEERGP